MLGEFCSHHSNVVRGRACQEVSAESPGRIVKLLAEADNVVRACLKTMIAEGMPSDWNEAAHWSALRLNPPRAESEIPSVKSDSLSWSVEEQREIDRALEAVWQPIIETAPTPPSQVGPLTCSGVLADLVEHYCEQGIPYVIPHPARLYTAHPKWPRTTCEPLDERAEYYCERDVERHLRLWKDAAASKGLVQFEVPNDPDLYQPKHLDDWPLPLLSWHEEDSVIQDPSEETVTGNIVAKPNSTQVMDTEQNHRCTAEEKPTDPPSELPESVVSGLEREWSRLWRAFQHDVNVETDSLLHVLEAIHSRHVTERQRLTQAMADSGSTLKTIDDFVRTAGDVRVCPMYPRLRGFPLLTGEPLFRRSAPDGQMEQVAFKGWVYEVWDLWESRYRTQLKHSARGLPGAIRPRQQVLGDLRHIRNNLLHRGIAKRGEAASCEILQWFSEGERMQVQLRHVIDFLNQMGWLQLDSPVLVVEESKVSTWHINKGGVPEEPTPALVSVRPFVDLQQQDSRYRYGASVAFENMVFGTTPMGPEHEEPEAQARDRSHKWLNMTVDERGDLCVPELGTIPSAKLYRAYLTGEMQRGSGVWTPWVQFRK